MKNLNDPIGSQTRDLRPCSTVPQPTAPQRTVSEDKVTDMSRILKWFYWKFNLMR